MKKLFLIKEQTPSLQLKLFLSKLTPSSQEVPLIIPLHFNEDDIKNLPIPDEADFAVCSSGTTGKPKIYFRTLKSWKDFIPEQNNAFNVSSQSRIFIHGSLSFTGNLNTAVQAHFTKAFLYCSSSLNVHTWIKEITENTIDTIYMIPDKLIHLAKSGRTFPAVKSIFCGSQFIADNKLDLIFKAFPSASIFLYYGTSETSFISYKKIERNTKQESHCTGKPFPSVKVQISNDNHILVDSPWSVTGITGFFDTKDTGFIKDGSIYLSGRSDDVINIHGEKINKSRIEELLLNINGIEECKITAETSGSRIILTAHIAGTSLPEKIPAQVLNSIPHVFIPSKYIRYEKLPRSESGKINLSCIQ